MYSGRIPVDFWGSLSVDPFCFLPAALTVNFLGPKIVYLIKNLEFPSYVSPYYSQRHFIFYNPGGQMCGKFSPHQAILQHHLGPTD